ncbi:hypothetical protein ACWPM1_11780 [Tsuneonella sp. HG249]
MTAKHGYIVLTSAMEEPYMVILEHEDGPDTETAVSTIRQGEDLIREKTPAPPKRDTTFDRPASDALLMPSLSEIRTGAEKNPAEAGKVGRVLNGSGARLEGGLKGAHYINRRCSKEFHLMRSARE